MIAIALFIFGAKQVIIEIGVVLHFCDFSRGKIFIQKYRHN